MPDKTHTLDVGFYRRELVYNIDFMGGPLDGSSIETDERPSCGEFTHRWRSRTYTYHYEEEKPNCFIARFGRRPEAPARPVSLWEKLRPTSRAAAWIGLAIVVTSIAAGWLLSQI